MPNQVVQQPNGRFALFSTIVDDFVRLNCTEQEMLEALLQDGFNVGDAWAKIVRAKLNCEHQSRAVASELLARWVACMSTIRMLHGDKRAQEIIDAIPNSTGSADGT